MENEDYILLDDLFMRMKPFIRPIKPLMIERLKTFVESLGLEQGKLYRSKRSLPWIYGSIDDVDARSTLGERSIRGSCVFDANANQWFMFVDLVFLDWIDSFDSQKYYFAFLKCVIDDRIAYFPVPPEIIGSDVEKAYKALFSAV